MKRKLFKKGRIRITTLLALVFFLVACTSVSATIINVPDDYSTIQGGINASYDGDTVLVQPDTYVENIDFNGHNIVLGSLFLTTSDTSYISSTIIDGNAADRVVKFVSGETSDAKIIGFTITNGSTPYTGAGIYCGSGSNPIISNNIITGNIAHTNHGGGIRCSDSSPTISNNIITGNQARYLGGGISINDGSPIIINNIITENSANEWDGGGIDCDGDISAIISYNIISGNTANGVGGTGYGGGIDCYNNTSPNLTISYNLISGNSAKLGGGILCQNAHPTIINNTITGNSASSTGGGILCGSGSNPTITNTIFWADTAPTSSEIHSGGGSSPVITYCDVQGGWEGEGNINCNPQFCYPDTGNYYLHQNSCCVGAGEEGVDIGAFGVGCGGCVYVPGDINGDSSVMGNDVTYGVRYFKGLGDPPPDSCQLPDESWLYVAGDANGSCSFTGSDVTFLVGFFKGYTPEIFWCPDIPPDNPPLTR
ncbi:MAG: hypothetical protein DRP26_06620 [Candidatus Zixiibacteriota bacterium]|nr:MAG: hypothetical protein DRP26_06620 [candidate division Zixibacteria bacterium]